jgi:Zn-dependent M16 (insulinase) family peptidase
MKKIISLTLALCLILTMCFQVTINADAAEGVLKPLPQLGEVVSGFKTVDIQNMDLINSNTVLFEHEKTGAKLLYIQNKDTDRSFNIAFKTPAVDNTGVNHILEHVSVSGSQKYPIKNGLFSVINQTYCTYANAFTSPSYTTYPISSMSEAQLLKFTDLYLDGVYNPLVTNDKNIFSREAWRYDMTDSDSPLTITGTVYNEMKGSLGNISTAAYYNVCNALFPNSVQSNISGGNPDNIKDLTYDQLIKTHNTYYQPSNSLMILYGNVDYEKFLKLINDEYLSKYDKKDIKIETGKVTPTNKKVDKTYKFPVGASSNTKNASEIDYAYALTDVSEEDSLAFKIIASILNQDTSPLKKAFNEKQIGGSLTVSFSSNTVQPVFTFTVQNADESKKAEFKTLVDKCMGDIVKKGFDKTVIDAIIAATLKDYSNLTELGNLGVQLSMEISSAWATTDSISSLNNITKDIKNIGTKAEGNYLESLISKYIINNNHAAIIATIPEAGLSEKNTSSETKYLADLKASMSSEQISKIVADTKSFTEWSDREDDQMVIKSLQAVKVADLPVEIKKYSINDTLSSDGVRLISAEANVGDTETTSLYLDTSGVPIEKLHYLNLYSHLLGTLDTKTYTKEELNTKSIRYLSGSSFYLDTISSKDKKQFTPYLAISWTGLIDEYDDQLELIKDIYLNTKFDNTEDILNTVKNLIANLKNTYTSEPLYLQAARSSALLDDSASYQNYTNGLDYYNFLNNLEKKLQSDPKSVVAELEAVKELVVNKTNMITAFSGNKSYIQKYQDAIKIITDALPSKSITKQDYTKIPKPAQREGIAVDSTVQYNMISANYEKMGTAFSGKFIPLQTIINENYTTPKLRFGNGVYSAIESFSTDGFIMASYRDPYIKETFDIYKGLPDFLKNIDLTQEDLDRYILNAYSSYTTPKGELSGAENAIYTYLEGYTPEDQLKILSEIKSLTVQDVKDSSVILENFIKNGNYSTAGSLQKLNENKELYDAIISIDQEAQNNTVTRAQFFEIVLAGVENPVEFAKQQGLLAGDGKGNYYESRKLTREEFAVIIYKVAVLNGLQLGGNEIKISDINSVSPYAKGRVEAVVNSGVIKLDDSGKFNPQGEVSSADIQTILNDLTSKLTGN